MFAKENLMHLEPKMLHKIQIDIRRTLDQSVKEISTYDASVGIRRLRRICHHVNMTGDYI